MKLNEEKISPIVIFVYNRLSHTKRTLEALQRNDLADLSDLIIFSDGARDADSEAVNEVRAYIKEVQGFKSVKIFESEKNNGLASSIINGINKVLKRYESVIVLEDDIVTSKYFLSYMNMALTYFKDKSMVWHINGWGHPIGSDLESDFYLTRMMICWGWATWREKWSHFSKDITELESVFDSKMKKGFNLEIDNLFWNQVELNKQGKLNTWAIFWYAAIFKNNGLCLSPIKSFVENIGFDGSGVNCDKASIAQSKLNDNYKFSFDSVALHESYENYQKIQRYYLDQRRKPSFVARVKNKIIRTFKRIKP